MQLHINGASMIPIYEQIVDQVKSLACKSELVQEERQKEVQAYFEKAIQKGQQSGLSKQEIQDLFEVLLEDVR